MHPLPSDTARDSHSRPQSSLCHRTARRAQACVQVLRVPGTPRNHAAVDWILPIDIDPVKDSWRTDSWGKIATDVDIDARTHKLANVGRLGGIGEALRVCPSSKRNEDFQFGKL